MHIATAHLKSASPYSQSKHYEVEKLPKEQPDAYDKRTWRERLHCDAKTGEIFIPPMAFKNCLSETAKFLSMRIPGKGTATYTKHFESGLLVKDPVMLGIYKQDVVGEPLFVPSDGKRGGGKRVMRMFPLIPEWAGVVIVYILDDTITEEVFKEHLEQGGQFRGVGRFRPMNNGFYGRFDVTSIKWEALNR